MAAYPSILIGWPDFKELPRAWPTIRTDYERGYVHTRARATQAPRQYELTHVACSAADVSTWNTFWDARKGGVEAFDFTDPRTGGVISCRFLHSESNPPEIKPRGGGNVAFDIGPIRLEEAL